MTIATIGQGANSVMTRQPNAAEIAAMTMENVWWLAEKVAATRMFPGLTTPESVFTMMMICQSRGLHPIEAIMRYDIIENKPALKAATIQAEFQARGGKIKILRTDATEARAFFSHPVLQPDGFEFHVTYDQFEKTKAIYGKDGIKKNWRDNPADMLWWRLVSKSIRRIDPGIVVGLPASEELRDEIDRPFETAPQLTATVTTAEGTPVNVAEARLPGQSAPGADSRPYPTLVSDSVTATNEVIAELASKVPGGEIPVDVSAKLANNFMANALIQASLHPGPMPLNGKEAAIMLARCYSANRDWMRRTLHDYLAAQVAEAEAIIAKKLEQVAAPKHSEKYSTPALSPEPEQAPAPAPAPDEGRQDPPDAEEPPAPPQPTRRSGRQQQTPVQPQQPLLREPGDDGDDD